MLVMETLFLHLTRIILQLVITASHAFTVRLQAYHFTFSIPSHQTVTALISPLPLLLLRVQPQTQHSQALLAPRVLQLLSEDIK